MSDEMTYTGVLSEVGKQMAELHGEMSTGFARIDGAIGALAQSIEASNSARVAEHVELRKDVDDQEHRIRQHDRDIAAALTRVAHVEVTTVTPRKLWTVALGAIGAMTGIAAVIVNAAT